MDRLAYLLKRYFPKVFGIVEQLAKWLAVVRFGHAIDAALDCATITGNLQGRCVSICPLNVSDLRSLQSFFFDLPDDHLHYFRPHELNRPALKKVLASRVTLTYGLFIDGKLSGYGLLKVSPTGAAFLGLLVAPGNTGLGLGKFLVAYLYWQASVAGLKTRSTVSKKNPASIRAHEAVAPFRIIADLPDDYMMIEFPDEIRDPPQLGPGSQRIGAQPKRP